MQSVFFDMHPHIHQYYLSSSHNQRGPFHSVVELTPTSDCEACFDLSPDLKKSWFELSLLTAEERIDFTYDFWLQELPFDLKLSRNLENFFDNLDEIHLFLLQRNFGEPFIPEMVYSLKEDSGFFHGSLPIGGKELSLLEENFQSPLLPRDYLAFLSIHNGFSKFCDTGIFSAKKLMQEVQPFQEHLKQRDPLVLSKTQEILSPESLIPFYESFSMPCFQCFCSEWYAEDEMGNLYYSGIDHQISDFTQDVKAEEIMAYPSFLEWLAFYLETI